MKFKIWNTLIWALSSILVSQSSSIGCRVIILSRCILLFLWNENKIFISTASQTLSVYWPQWLTAPWSSYVIHCLCLFVSFDIYWSFLKNIKKKYLEENVGIKCIGFHLHSPIHYFPIHFFLLSWSIWWLFNKHGTNFARCSMTARLQSFGTLSVLQQKLQRNQRRPKDLCQLTIPTAVLFFELSIGDLIFSLVTCSWDAVTEFSKDSGPAPRVQLSIFPKYSLSQTLVLSARIPPSWD